MTKVIAHRGSLPETENTLAAFELAFDSGADMVECDVIRTRDGVLIASHDLEGLNNRDYSSFTAEEKLRHPTFQSMIDLAKAKEAETGRKVGFLVETKGYSTYDRAGIDLPREVIEMMAENEVDADTWAYQDFSTSANRDAHEAMEDLGVDYPIYQLGFFAPRTNQPDYIDGVAVRSNFLSQSRIDDYHENGLEVFVWTVEGNGSRDASNINRWADRGVDGVILDWSEFGRTVVDARDGVEAEFGSDAADSLIFDGGDQKIFARGGDDVIDARDGDDVIFGDAGDDVIDGGAGNDQLTGGSGDDELTGGAGADSFVYLTEGAGDDVIYDFGAGDVIVFGDDLFTSFAQVRAATSSAGSDAIIDLGAGNSIRLDDVSASSLNADDFLFV